MNTVLWVLQIVAALLYGPAGIVKMFLSEKMNRDFQDVRALSPNGWRVVGIFEVACAIGLVVPAALHWRPELTVVAAIMLAVESVTFVASRIKHQDVAASMFSVLPALAMAFVAYGRSILDPIG
ncbi:MAG: DoxX family protein [Rhodanobacteraceae bacterium]